MRVLRVVLVLVFVAYLCACRPVSSSAPEDHGCAYAGQIRAVWTRDADWAIGIAMRESHCDPAAYNPSGASGLFQLLNHGDLLAAVCLDGDPFLADCNIRAAWLLYQGMGRSPWRL